MLVCMNACVKNMCVQFYQGNGKEDILHLRYILTIGILNRDVGDGFEHSVTDKSERHNSEYRMDLVLTSNSPTFDQHLSPQAGTLSLSLPPAILERHVSDAIIFVLLMKKSKGRLSYQPLLVLLMNCRAHLPLGPLILVLCLRHLRT